jgi:hypothetical protein
LIAEAPEHRSNNYDEWSPVVAKNAVHHSKELPSSLTITVIQAPPALVRRLLKNKVKPLPPGGEVDERSSSGERVQLRATM